MGAEVPMWVEVEVSTKVWREVYAVTSSEALLNASLGVGERLTGRVRYEYEMEEDDDQQPLALPTDVSQS